MLRLSITNDHAKPHGERKSDQAITIFKMRRPEREAVIMPVTYYESYDATVNMPLVAFMFQNVFQANLTVLKRDF